MVKKTTVKKAVKATEAKPKAKSKATTKAKSKAKPKRHLVEDTGIVIVDDDIKIDQDKINEERRAYLEETRSQEAFD